MSKSRREDIERAADLIRGDVAAAADPSHRAALSAARSLPVVAAQWLDASAETWRAITDQRGAVETAEATLGDAVRRLPVTLERADYDVWLTIEDYNERGPDAEQYLAEIFGHALDRARWVHQYVRRRLEQAERDGRTVELVDSFRTEIAATSRRTTTATPYPKRARRMASDGTFRPLPSLQALGKYLNIRSSELGFAATEVIAKDQGRRGLSSQPLRDARARIVSEMYDDFNASLAQLAALFSRQRRAIEVLRDRGRVLRQQGSDKEEHDG